MKSKYYSTNILFHSGPENLKQSRQKKEHVKSNKSKNFFREIAFLAVLKHFPNSKNDFWP